MKGEELTWNAFLQFTVDGYRKGEIKIGGDLSLFDLAIQFAVGKLYERGHKHQTCEMIHDEMLKQCGKDIFSDENEKVFLKANMENGEMTSDA